MELLVLWVIFWLEHLFVFWFLLDVLWGPVDAAVVQVVVELTDHFLVRVAVDEIVYVYSILPDFATRRF